jgi:hypothetical protein
MHLKKFAIALLFLVGAASALAQQVYVDYNRDADFTKFHTYAWGAMPNANQIANSFLAQQAQSEINSQLQFKGLALVQESQNPDLIVVMSGGLKQQTSYTAMTTGGRWLGGTTTVTPETNTVGTLIVDVYNAKHLLWRGMASDTLNSNNATKNNKTVAKAVQKMFKQFP